MSTAIEITSRAIRYCSILEGKLSNLGSVPITADQGPLETLKLAPLPRPLGRVSLLIQHPDMLQQTMIQPPCPADRLDRIVRFELLSLIPDAESVLSTFRVAPIGGDDMRLLVNLAKRELVTRIGEALKPHGGHLAALSLPAAGLYDAWRASTASVDTEACALVVDMGGRHTHIAVVKGEDLIFTRTHKGGLDDLVDGIAELRGIDRDEAQTLVSRLGKGAPDDVRNLIRNTAHSMSASLTSVLRFTSAQLKISPLTPQALYLAGGGGQIPGFMEALGERSALPVRLINPFAGLSSKMHHDELDTLVALPSPWTNVIGAARSSELCLDVMQQVRQEKVAYWSTHGLLRVAVLAAVALMALALIRQWHASGVAAEVSDRLGANGSGLVPQAETQEQRLQTLIADKERDLNRVQFLQRQQEPGKIAIEFLGAVAQSIDPQTRRVVIERYQIFRSPSGMRILMTGTAQASGSNGLGEVLNDFRQSLREHYPLIQSVSDLGSSIENNAMVFQWELALAENGTSSEVYQTDDDLEPTAPARSIRGSRSGS